MTRWFRTLSSVCEKHTTCILGNINVNVFNATWFTLFQSFGCEQRISLNTIFNPLRHWLSTFVQDHRHLLIWNIYQFSRDFEYSTNYRQGNAGSQQVLLLVVSKFIKPSLARQSDQAKSIHFWSFWFPAWEQLICSYWPRWALAARRWSFFSPNPPNWASP